MNKFREKMKGLNRKKIGITAGIICGALLIIYVGLSVFFISHFYFASTVNGVKSSGSSAKTVAKRISDTAKDYKIDIVDENGQTEYISGEEIDFAVSLNNNEVDKLLDKQNGFLWIKYLFSPKEYISTDIVSFDENKLKKKVAALSCVTNERPTPTKDATIIYKGKEFVIVPEEYGTTVEEEDFTNKVGIAVRCLKPRLKLDEDDCYLQPKVTADSRKLKKLASKMNKMLSSGITYTVGSKKEEVPQDTIAGFITYDGNLSVAYNTENMTAFVKEMSRKYNTYGHAKQLNSSYGTVVTVPGGNYGWKIDVEGEVAKLQEELQNVKHIKRDFVYAYTANSRDGNDYGNSYVEINLTAQHLFLYKNGQRILESDFVSGNPFKGNATPTGAYQITYTEKDAVLKGENYRTPVSYWMPFCGNVGMHDATWRGSFGGQIYRTNGSHGCVNLPKSVAQRIFEQVGKGFPVLVYQLGGTESDTAMIDAAQNIKNMINAIGEVTLESEPYLVDIRNQYEALSPEAKQVVDNFAILEAAEIRLSQLKQEAADAAAAQAAQEEQARINQEQANSVISAIDKALSSQDAKDIEEAYNAYNALSEEAKHLVPTDKYSSLMDLYTQNAS